MGHYQTCPKCWGLKFLDDHYDAELEKWIKKNCPECDGLGEVWVED